MTCRFVGQKTFLIGTSEPVQRFHLQVLLTRFLRVLDAVADHRTPVKITYYSHYFGGAVSVSFGVPKSILFGVPFWVKKIGSVFMVELFAPFAIEAFHFCFYMCTIFSFPESIFGSESSYWLNQMIGIVYTWSCRGRLSKYVAGNTLYNDSALSL